MTRYFLSVVMAVILTGCAVHPLPDQVTRQSTLAIVTAIRCEAGQAILEYARDPAYDGGAIGFFFDFDITEHNHAGLDLTFRQPFSIGAFQLDLSGGNSDLLREAHRRFTMVDTFLELKQAVTQAKCSPEALQSRFHYPIAGAIGLNEVIGTAIGIDNLGKLDPVDSTTVGGQTAVFSDKLAYQTVFDSGKIVPTLTLNEIPGVFRLTSASASLKSDRTDVHTLTLAIALPEPPKSSPKAKVRTAARQVPVTQALLTTHGIPSKVLINGTENPRLCALWELDRLVLLDCATRSGSPIC
jgi:hypothetical protein